MKKTNKHPLTFFREANEKRQATVKNSLKKAQYGTQMNDGMTNKANSTNMSDYSMDQKNLMEGDYTTKPSEFQKPSTESSRDEYLKKGGSVKRKTK